MDNVTPHQIAGAASSSITIWGIDIIHSVVLKIHFFLFFDIRLLETNGKRVELLG